MANPQKVKGSNAERLYAEKFRELGFSFCKTSRQANRKLDDAGVDLCFLPFNVQIKAGYKKGINPHKILDIIPERLSEFFPGFDPVHGYPRVLIHQLDVGRGKRRTKFDSVVYIYYKEISKFINHKDFSFNAIVKEGQKRGYTFSGILKEGIYNSIKYRMKKTNEFVLIMTFEKFINLII